MSAAARLFVMDAMRVFSSYKNGVE
jgi:hypothetical protein